MTVENLLSVQELFIRTCEEPLGFIMSAQLTNWQLLWILAHEMAHVALGHVARSPIAVLKVVGIPDGVRIYSPEQQMEIEADIRATAYMLEVFHTLEQQNRLREVVLPSPVFLGAPVLLLMYFSYVEMLCWKPGMKRCGSHPLAKERLSQLQARYEDEFARRPIAYGLIMAVQNMILRASYEIMDQLGRPRPGALPTAPDIDLTLGDRID